MVFAIAMAGGFIFGTRPTASTVVLYTLLYVGVFLIGFLAITIAKNVGMPSYLSGLVVIITAPLTFLGGRWLFTRPGAQREGTEP